MKLKLDLHIHSQASADGRMTLDEIVSGAKAAGLDGAAVCDHDRVLTQAPEYPNFLLIPGVEVSTERGHLLGLFVSAPIGTHTFRDAVDAIHAQGGLAVLAHPFEHSADPDRIAPIAPLLDGVETWNSRAERKNRRANAMAEDFARAHGLRRFGGSDAHLPQEVGRGFTQVEADALTPDAVKAALIGGGATVSGRPSPARYAAASQLTRRKKTGSSPLGYCKWALFALKCCLRDITG